APMEIGEEVSFDIERGKTLVVKLNAVGEVDDKGRREVYFELNGQPRSIHVVDKKATRKEVVRERATDAPGQVGAPMPGAVVDVRVKVGDTVEAGAPLVVLSAMKMETIVAAPTAGKVARLAVTKGDTVSP